MKVECKIMCDLEKGTYSIKFSNLDKRISENIDYNQLEVFLKKVFEDLDRQLKETGIESTDNFTKLIH